MTSTNRGEGERERREQVVGEVELSKSVRPTTHRLRWCRSVSCSHPG